MGFFFDSDNARIPVTNSVKGATTLWKYISDAPTHSFLRVAGDGKKRERKRLDRKEPSGGGIAAKTTQTGKPIPSASDVGVRLPQTPTDIGLHSSALSY